MRTAEQPELDPGWLHTRCLKTSLGSGKECYLLAEGEATCGVLPLSDSSHPDKRLMCSVLEDGTKVRYLKKTGEIIGRKFEGQKVAAQ